MFDWAKALAQLRDESTLPGQSLGRACCLLHTPAWQGCIPLLCIGLYILTLTKYLSLAVEFLSYGNHHPVREAPAVVAGADDGALLPLLLLLLLHQASSCA
jgi:hypothetical protein